MVLLLHQLDILRHGILLPLQRATYLFVREDWEDMATELA